MKCPGEGDTEENIDFTINVELEKPENIINVTLEPVAAKEDLPIMSTVTLEKAGVSTVR